MKTLTSLERGTERHPKRSRQEKWRAEHCDWCYARSMALSQAFGTKIGAGVSSGSDRARNAAVLAVLSAMAVVRMGELSHILIAVRGGDSMTIREVNEAAEYVARAVGLETEIEFESGIDERLGDRLEVILATFTLARAAEAELI